MRRSSWRRRRRRLAWRSAGTTSSPRGTCGDATYEFSVEAEDGGLEVTFELQSAAPGETWDVAVEQGGTSLLQGERQTDEDAELDVDVFADEAGSADSPHATPPDAGRRALCCVTLTRAPPERTNHPTDQRIFTMLTRTLP